MHNLSEVASEQNEPKNRKYQDQPQYLGKGDIITNIIYI